MDPDGVGEAIDPDPPRSQPTPLRVDRPPGWGTHLARGLIGGTVGAVAIVSLSSLSPAAPSDATLFPIGIFLLGAPIGIAVAYWTRGVAGFVGLFLGGLLGTVIGVRVAFGGSYPTDGWGLIFALVYLGLVPVLPVPGYIVGRLVDRVVADQTRRTTRWRTLIRSAALLAPLVFLGVAGAASAISVGLGRQGSCPTVEPAPGLPGRVAFVATEGGAFYTNAICVVDVSTGDQIFMFEGDTTTDRSFGVPSWAPDGSAFVVEATTDNQPSSVIVPLDGSPTTTLTPPDGAWSVREPDWSPDGRRIAAVVDEHGCGDCGRLAFFDLSTGRWELALTTLPEGLGEPDWSPDGELLVVRGRGDGAGSLAPAIVIRDDGTVVGTVADDMGTYIDSAAWSTDGGRIAIPRRSDRGIADLWVVGQDGADGHQVTFTGNADDPVWSPDGHWLAFNWYDVEAVADASQIWVVAVEGGDPRLLVDGGINAAWSP